MRRALVFLSVAMIIAFNGSPVTTAATPPGPPCEGATCHFSGIGVDGSWTTIPESGPVAGIEYTETFVNAGTSSERARGTLASSMSVYVSETTIVFDSSLQFATPIRVRYGFGASPDVSVAFGPRLSSATVHGAILMTTCEVDENGVEVNCDNGVSTTIDGSWTATGAASMQVNTSHWRMPGLSGTSTSHGTQRPASASVVLGGTPAGTMYWADLNDSRSNTVQVCHNC